MAESLPDVEALGPEDLKGLVLQLLEEVAALRAETAVLREEIGRLKGLTGRPKIKPSGMDKATDPKPGDKEAQAPWPWRQAFEVDHRRGAHRQGRGSRRLAFKAREVLRAGLETAQWITVDDTGARHKAANGVCTQVGDHRFAWFGTTFSKSRLNFLSLLRAGHGDCVVNAAALDYMRKRSLSGAVIALLAEQGGERFADEDAWMAHLERLGMTKLKVHPDPVRIATEGALMGQRGRSWLPA